MVILTCLAGCWGDFVIELLVLFGVSFIANSLSAFAGGGAGLLQLPVLLFLGLPFGTALATHKLATVALGIGASLRHRRERNLQWRFIGLVIIAGVPGVVLGANIILFVPDRAASLALGVLTLGLGVYSALQPRLGREYRPRHTDPQGMLIGGLVLFTIGVLNGSLTSGTGLFVTLWLVQWFGLDYQRGVAHTMVLVGLFWNGSGALALGLQGMIKWEWVPVLIIASLLGGYAGAHWSIRSGNRTIKLAYEVLTVVVGVKLIIG
ncbi:MAG: sulfite exporter TauE/SafE family protein [Gammaproteobacteria bacterium]|nr:sulfite exporter TauE/SafE family protein [Gammaproteobacteria bacterium]